MSDYLDSDQQNMPQDGSPGLPEDLASLMADLSNEQLELLQLLIEEQSPDLEETEILPQHRSLSDDNEHFLMPASFAQQRLWFLDQLEPDNLLYNLVTIVRLSGELIVPVLKQCIEEIILRHEILRTTLQAKDGLPYQVISPDFEFSLPEENLQGIASDEKYTEVIRLATDEAHKPFDLVNGPLLRVRLLHLNDAEHVVIVNVHHILADGWSVNVLIFEMALLYEAFISGMPSPLPPLPVQYADYAIWQKKYLRGPVLERQLEYWLTKLSDCQPVLNLPRDKPVEILQEASAKNSGRSYHFTVPDDLYKKLLEFSQGEAATLFMTLLAGFQVLLYRYSGQEDFNIGVPVANRTRAEIENLIGFFVNTLVLRAIINPENSFREFLASEKETVLEAFANQDLPFEVLVERLNLDRETGTSPLFQVMFALQNASKQNKKIPGLSLSVIPLESETAKFDLSLIMLEDLGSLSGAIEYKTNLFSSDLIERFINHYLILLSEITANPDAKVSEIKFLSNDELRQITINWNKTEALFESGHCIHELFEEQARIHPNTTALIFYDSVGKQLQMSYAELNQRADVLAGYLRENGVGPEILVGVLFHRSLEMIVAILGILKSGGAYLPLDPSYPVERLKFMVEDSQIRYLMVNDESASVRTILDILPLNDILVIHQEREWIGIEKMTGQLPDRSEITKTEVCADNLAYVIYTSGSTGRPKGALLQHRGICNLVSWQKETFLITRESRILQFSPLSFDASVWEIFMALANGAALCLTSQEILTDGVKTLNLIKELGITTITMPPSVLNALSLLPIWNGDPVSIEALPDLKTVIAAGEACPCEIVVKWAPGRKFFNAYGPTEATVCASSALCSDADLQSPPIGRPIHNTHLFVLDPNQQVVPPGVPGELYIGGVGVARGYLRRPEIDNEKFIPHPLYRYLIAEGQREMAEEILYRTGDLVRFSSSGELKFFGRIDQQVKLRGYRIELGEIEAVLLQYGKSNLGRSLFRETAVVVHQMESGLKRLVAFLVGDETNISNLRAFLHTVLPDFMIPSLFVWLESLPLNPSGKVDRNKLSKINLPELHHTQIELQGLDLDNQPALPVSPRNPEEEIIVDLFRQTLRVNQVGINTNFFDQGGHSLIATQLAARLRQVFQIDLPLITLFENPTPARIAQIVKDRIISQSMGDDVEQRLPLAIPRLPRYSDTDLPVNPPQLSFAQERLWFLEQFDPGTPSYNIPTVMKVKGFLNFEALQLSLDQIVNRHEVLRTSFITIQGRAVQVIQPDLKVEIQIEDLQAPPAETSSDSNGNKRDLSNQDQELLETKVLTLVSEEISKPFDIKQAPLFRLKIIRLSDQECIIVLCMHHLISDGWSMSVLIRELSALYTAILVSHEKGNQSTAGDKFEVAAHLPVLPIQYADFATWQRDWLKGGAFDQQLSYWRDQLSDPSPILNFPMLRTRPESISSKGAWVGFEIDNDLAAKIDDISREAGVTLYMTLLGAFQVFLMRLCSEEDISVGTPIAGRVHSDIENLIGFFVNTLVMRTRLNGDPDYREILRRVRLVALDAYAHQDLPFELLVNELNPVRNLAHSPLFQVMFVFQNIPFEPLELPELTVSLLDQDTEISRFDLTLSMAGSETGLSGVFEYRQDLFDKETIEGFVDIWKILLFELASNPDSPITQIDIPGLPDWSLINFTNQSEFAQKISASDLEPRISTAGSPRTPEEAILLEIWSSVLGQDEIGIFDNYFELGGDSIISIQVVALAAEAGLQITPRQIFEHQTIAELAEVAGHGVSTIGDQGLVIGEAPLTPIQHWFFELQLPNPSHFNQSLLFQVNQSLDPSLLEKTVQLLMVQHDALRARFQKSETGWKQAFDHGDGNIPFLLIDIIDMSPEDMVKVIESNSDRAQLNLNILDGPLFQLVYFNAGEQEPGRLLFVIHHLAVDAISWRILLEDFQLIYKQLLVIRDRGLNMYPQLRLKTSSYQTWARRLVDYSKSDNLMDEIGYWKNVLQKPYQAITIERTKRKGRKNGSSTSTNVKPFGSLHRSLSSDDTRSLLDKVMLEFSAEHLEILLAALITAYADWYDPAQEQEINLLIDIESHGRQQLWSDIDITRTVGWFTYFYPVYLTRRPSENIRQNVSNVKNILRQVPQRGIGYGILQYLDAGIDPPLKSLSQPQIIFNYLGQVDRFLVHPQNASQNVTRAIQADGLGMFKPASESSGVPFNMNIERPYLIEINAAVINGQLQVDWTFNERKIRREVIDKLADAYQSALARIVEYCISDHEVAVEPAGYSASDFPLAGVDQAGIDKVINRLTKKNKPS